MQQHKSRYKKLRFPPLKSFVYALSSSISSLPPSPISSAHVYRAIISPPGSSILYEPSPSPSFCSVLSFYSLLSVSLSFLIVLLPSPVQLVKSHPRHLWCLITRQFRIAKTQMLVSLCLAPGTIQHTQGIHPSIRTRKIILRTCFFVTMFAGCQLSQDILFIYNEQCSFHEGCVPKSLGGGLTLDF